jgi:hypothetical protein
MSVQSRDWWRVCGDPGLADGLDGPAARGGSGSPHPEPGCVDWHPEGPRLSERTEKRHRRPDETLSGVTPRYTEPFGQGHRRPTYHNMNITSA